MYIPSNNFYRFADRKAKNEVVKAYMCTCMFFHLGMVVIIHDNQHIVGNLWGSKQMKFVQTITCEAVVSGSFAD